LAPDSWTPLKGALSSISCSSIKDLLLIVNNTFKFYRKNSTPKDARIFAPQHFSLWRKIPQISKYGITLMVTSNGGHPLHHHLRHSCRLSNSLFNRRTTKFQPSCSGRKPPHCSSPPSGLLGRLFPP